MKYLKTYEHFDTTILLHIMNDILGVITTSYIDEDRYCSTDWHFENKTYTYNQVLEKLYKKCPYLKMTLKYEGSDFSKLDIELDMLNKDFQEWLIINRIKNAKQMYDYILPELKEEYDYLFDSEELGLF